MSDDFCKFFNAMTAKYTLRPTEKYSKTLEYKVFVKLIYDKLIDDKGYIGKDLFQRLFVDEIQLITKLKSNMKRALMSISNRLLLRKNIIIETVNDELKNIAQVRTPDIDALTISLSIF